MGVESVVSRVLHITTCFKPAIEGKVTANIERGVSRVVVQERLEIEIVEHIRPIESAISEVRHGLKVIVSMDNVENWLLILTSLLSSPGNAPNMGSTWDACADMAF